MSAVAFDTLKFARSLQSKAKLTPEQAEGFADAFSEVMRDDVVTKNEAADSNAALRKVIDDTRADLKKAIDDTRVALKSEINDLRVSVREDFVDLRSKLRETELRMDAKLEATKSEIVRWMFGTIGFQTLIFLGAVIALVRVIH